MKNTLKFFIILALLVLPNSVFAEQEIKQQSVSIEIGNDFYSAGGLVELKQASADDAYLAGAIVNVDKRVENDLVAAGSALTITAEIGDDLRVAGSAITLTSGVGGDAVIVGGVVNIMESSTIAGDASIAGGLLNFGGNVGGDLQLASDEIIFSGSVGGDTEIRLGKSLNFGQDAKINGKLTYYSDKEIDIPAGVAASIERKDFNQAKNFIVAGKGGGFDLTGKLFTLIIGFVAGAVLLALYGRATETFATVLRTKFWWSLFAGVLAFFTPLLAILLFASMIGVWVGGILLVAWILALLVTGALTGFTVGSLIFKQKKETKYSRKLIALAVGGVIFGAISFIPGFGGALNLTIFVLTLGALVISEKELYKAAKKAKLL